MNYNIIIKGESRTDHFTLSDLHGIDCGDNFAEYFNNHFTFKDNIKDGYMSFEYDSDQDKLFTITSYTSNKELTKDELEVLKNYTTGQWSDGIGEGFEQEPCFYGNSGEEDVYISPWFMGQEVEVIQSEIK
jgi:hypothetical protein